MGVHQFAIAETHKFGHVTYFWNGNNQGYIDPALEEYVEIHSDSNEMIATHPEMKVLEVTDRLIEACSPANSSFCASITRTAIW